MTVATHTLKLSGAQIIEESITSKALGMNPITIQVRPENGTVLHLSGLEIQKSATWVLEQVENLSGIMKSWNMKTLMMTINMKLN